MPVYIPKGVGAVVDTLKEFLTMDNLNPFLTTANLAPAYMAVME